MRHVVRLLLLTLLLLAGQPELRASLPKTRVGNFFAPTYATRLESTLQVPEMRLDNPLLYGEAVSGQTLWTKFDPEGLEGAVPVPEEVPPNPAAAIVAEETVAEGEAEAGQMAVAQTNVQAATGKIAASKVSGGSAAQVRTPQSDVVRYNQDYEERFGSFWDPELRAAIDRYTSQGTDYQRAVERATEEVAKKYVDGLPKKDFVGGNAKAIGGASAVEAGKLGESAVTRANGIPKNTERIPSATGKKEYRTPDQMDVSQRWIGETKNVDYQYLSSQLKDDAAHVLRGGYPGRVDVTIDLRTKISINLLRQHLNPGSPIKLNSMDLNQ